MSRRRAPAMSLLGAAIQLSVVTGCGDRDDRIGSRSSVNLPAPENQTPNGVASDVIDTTVRGDEVLSFHEHGCPDCEVVREELLPRFLALRGLAPESVRSFDVERPQVVRALLALERRLGFRAETLAPVVIFSAKAYCGVEALEAAVEAQSGTRGGRATSKSEAGSDA